VLAVYQSSSPAVVGALGVGRTASARQGLTRSLHTRARIRARVGAVAGTARALDRSALADAYQTEVLYASATELVQDGIDNCALSQPTKTVTGTVAGVSADQYGILSLGGASELFIGGTTTNPVTFTDVPVGPVDLIATRMTSTGTPPDKAFIVRDLNIPDGGSLPSTIDFNGAAVVPATASATVTGAAGDDLEIFTELVTAKHRLLMWFDLAPSRATIRPWAGIPGAAMANGEFHTLVVFASPSGSSDFRVSLKYVGTVTNQTLALGPTINLPAASQVAGGTYPRFRFQGGFSPDYDKGASGDVMSTREEGNAYSIIATTAYLTGPGSAVAYDFTMPDVSALPGFPVAARLTTGVNEVLASAFGFTGPGIFDLRANLGSDFKAAARSFTIAVP